MKPEQRVGLLKTSSLREEALKKIKSPRQHSKVEEQMKLAREKEELTKQTEDAVSEFKNKIRFLKKGIEVAEMSVEEGNNELGEAMKAKERV